MEHKNVTSTCPLFPDNPHRCDVLINIKRAVGALSILGCTFIIVLSCLFRKWKEFSQKMIILLSLSAMVDSIAYIFNDFDRKGAICYGQAFLISFFDWSTLIIVCYITFYIWRIVTKKERTFRGKSIFCFVCLVLIVPGLFASLPFIGNSYGPAGVWCWISDGNTIWRLTMWYVPMYVLALVMFLTNCYIVVEVFTKARQWDGPFDFEREQDKGQFRKDVKRLLVYPPIYLVVTVPPLIDRIYSGVHRDEEPNYGLSIATAVAAPLLGALNSIAFAFDKETLSRLNCDDIRTALASHLKRNNYQVIDNYHVDDVTSPNPQYGAV